MLIGYLGVNFFQGGGEIAQASGDLEIGPSLRVGAMAGYYVHPQISLNAELTIDLLHFDHNYTGSDYASPIKRGELAFSPLVHIPTVQDLELALGPKLGLWAASADTHGPSTWSMRGYLLGINLGAYLKVGEVFVGGLVSYDSATFTKMCQGDSCADQEVLSRGTDKVWSVVGSVLY